MSRIIRPASGHTMHVQRVAESFLPACISRDESSLYRTHYVVRNFDATGVVFFYLAKGHAEDARECVAWYPSGKMFTGCGDTMLEVVNAAQMGGWMYAR